MAEFALEGDARGLVGSSPRQSPADLAELVASGVDDLTKFQILTYLCRRPGAVGDAAHFAHSLGLWSTERTEAALAEMARSGLIERCGDGSGHALYGLAGSSKAEHRLCATCTVATATEGYRELIARLATRSLRRVRPRGRRTVVAAEGAEKRRV